MKIMKHIKKSVFLPRYILASVKTEENERN